MFFSATKVSRLTALFLGVSVFTFAGNAYAVSCLEGAAKASDEAISTFKADPSGLLENNKSGGLPLANATRSLLASDSDTLNLVVDLIGKGSSSQQSAIGAGAARAASACATPQPEYAAEIQKAIADTENKLVLSAFRTANDEISTAALGGDAGDAGSVNVVGGPQSSGGGGGANGNGTSSASGASTSSFSTSGAGGTGTNGQRAVANASPST